MKHQRTIITGGNQFQVDIEINENHIIDHALNLISDTINYYTDQGYSVNGAIEAAQDEVDSRIDNIAFFQIRDHPTQN